MVERVRIREMGYFMGLFLCALLVLVTTTDAQETMKFDSEAKKLEFIRQMVMKEKVFIFPDSGNGPKPTLCEDRMLKDLKSGKCFEAIEPYIRADSADDPRLKKWEQCRGRDYHEFNIDPNMMFVWLPQLGAPPYRFYRLDLDGNKKNGLEDLVYNNGAGDDYPTGQVGYTWVDLGNCEIKGEIGIQIGILSLPNALSLNTLANYNGSIYALDYIEGISLVVTQWVGPEKKLICSYMFFDWRK